MVSLNKKILCMLLLGVFLINFSSALEFDNVKSYDPIAREVTIINSFGLGDEIGKARLNTPLNVKVGAGYQKVAEFDLWAYKDYSDALKQFEFKDMNDGKKKINRDYDLKYLSYEDVEVDDWESVCETVTYPNETMGSVCEYHKIGSHFEERKIWNKITPADLKKNDILTIGVFTEVQIGDYVDWIPMIYGVEINEWATWTADLNVDILSYWAFEEGAGNFLDQVSSNDMVMSGTVNRVGGKIGNGVEFDTSTSNYLTSESLLGITGNEERTVCFWAEMDDLATPHVFFNWGNSSTRGMFNIMYHQLAGYKLLVGLGAEDLKSGVAPTTSFQSHCLTWDGTSFEWYTDGLNIYNTTASGYVNTGNTALTIGKNAIADNYPADSIIDEVGIWSRVLTGTEINTQIYNGGSGNTYVAASDQSPNITLNSPASENFTSPQNLEINFTAWDDVNLTDVKLYVNNALNQTNASGINDTDYIFDLDLGDGDWTIYGRATDNESQETNSSSIRIVINSTPFIEFLTPPTLINYANVSQSYVPMKVNVSTSVFKNITYSLRNVNGTNYTQFYTNQTYDINLTGVQDGHYHYDVTICTTTGKCNTTETRHINHDVAAPEINLTSPTGTYDFLIEGYNLDLNWSVSDGSGNLDSCWYTYNSTTVPINCSLNTTSFNYSNFENSLVFYSNDTFGNVGNATATWNYLILEYDQDYDSQVTEGTPNTITKYLNVVGDTISSAVLSYNGTNYTTSLDYDSGNYTIASTVVAPLVDADMNITFQLFMTISGTTYSTPQTTQLIQAINFSVCTTGDQLLNIFLFDEEHKTDLSGTIEINAGLVSKISGEPIESVLTEVSSVSNLSICLDPISSVDNFYLDADIAYSSADYAKEFYFMRNAALTAIPINLSLFDLNLSSSTEFLIRYQGQSLIKVEGAIVQLQRYYISEGIYETVEAPLTSISGTAVVHIDLNTNKYKAIVVKDGEILDIFNDVVFDCENELSGQCTQNLYADVTPYNVVDGATLKDFSYAISDTGSKLVTTFSIPSGSTSAVNIVMTQKDQFGETTSCNRTVTTSSGSLECDYNSTIGDSYLFLEVSKDGESQAEKEYFVPEANGIDWGGLNWLFLFGLLISVSLMAISSPEWIVGNAVVVLVIGGALWMADGLNIVAGLGLILWVIVAAIILILEMANKEDR